jgi:hypothetical protein
MVKRHFAITLIAVCVLLGVTRAQQCKQTTFRARVSGGQGFSRALGGNLEFHLDSFVDNGGWAVRVSPSGTDKDWAYVVTPPLRFANAEWMGNGYGETVRHQLERTHEMRFVLNQEDYDRFGKLIDEALWPADPKDADRTRDNYERASQAVSTGRLLVKPLDFDKLGPTDQAAWMDFEVVVTVPKNFGGSTDLKWSDTSCPAPPK